MLGCSLEAEEVITLNALAERGEVLDGPMGFMGCTTRMMRLVQMWIAAAVVLLISIGAVAAQPNSGRTAAQPKQVLFLPPYGQNFEPWAVWSREARNELIRQSPWPLDIQEHSVVSARNDDGAAERTFVEYLRSLYA